ncbi:succinylglutamate desuccinylase [Vibrio sp. Of7-15]|uniref:succinylglutamate desuccinylase n=1 Tax=Vibrio sp. Of7-15 TaxID=2724879 RepID=UPI001EF3A8D2|nr:succinylglutamate desuccinylase [Vibrio sp. Of7-15]MCG7496295.1 succinylglutamate desuccinylase [Vibrio sp. Of7-15]
MSVDLFNGSFLAATLNMAADIPAQEWQLDSGANVIFHGRGILEIIPAVAGNKDLIISTGIHGDETGPMEITDQLVMDVLQGHVDLAHRCLFIIGHPQATNAFTRFIDVNLNRLFDGVQQETNLETQIANQLQGYVRKFFSSSLENQELWHLDLHSAIRDSEHYTFAVSPYTNKATRSEELACFLQEGEVEALMLSTSPSPTFSWFSAENFAAQALTMELGRVAPLGENNLDELAAFSKALRNLVCVQHASDTKWDGDSVKVYEVSRTLTKLSNDFALTFPNDTANFTYFSENTLLATDENGISYSAIEGGEAVVFPNANVAINQRACLLVKPVLTEFNSGQLVVKAK